jgi:LPPG:FO 2-phospho-L-lactate transferase
VRVTALAGGTGAAKLLRGLAACLALDELTVIGNTGDDTEVWGLHVSPDLDTVTYALAGVLDVARGWGRAAETFHCRDAMGTLGGPTWFSLGDRDLATHLVRTAALQGGAPLSAVTAQLAARFGLRARILPMSDEPVRTFVTTTAGRLTFQEYFVRDRAGGDVVAVDYVGAPAARPAPGVVDAIADADLIVACPSNPVTSLGPILAVPGVTAALGRARAGVVAVSPIVGGAPVSGPAGRLMQARGLEVSPLGVAAAYTPWLRTLLIDERDRAAAPVLERAGVRAVVADVLMTDHAREVALARRVLQAAG